MTARENHIDICPINSVYSNIVGDAYALIKLDKYLSFMVEGFQFIRKKRPNWDGRIRLLKPVAGGTHKRVYRGLEQHIINWCAHNGITVSIIDNPNLPQRTITPEEDIYDFVDELNIPLDVRDYQYDGIVKGIQGGRQVILSPTASGKSLMIYALTRYWLRQGKVLIIVPTTSLVEQMLTDFDEYGQLDLLWKSVSKHKIYGGNDIHHEADLTVSTWQSIYKQPKAFFGAFEAVIGDESHRFVAKSLTRIMTKMTECDNRVGFTGTLDDKTVHRLILEGLFGPVYRVVSTSQLITDGYLAQMKIYLTELRHEDSPRIRDYHSEVDYIVNHVPRKELLCDLISKLKGNTLVLFRYLQHGHDMYDYLNGMELDRPIYLMTGATKTEERERVRKIVDTDEQKNHLILASNIFTTGINIRLLDNIVFVAPSKSKIHVLQSIGRGLRKTDTKKKVRIFDFVDMIDTAKNYTRAHGEARADIYSAEGFPVIKKNLTV